MPDEEIIKTKVCLMGESSVGKSSLIRRFVLDVFDDAYISTIGTKVSKRSIDLSKGDKKYRMDMQIWDIMGNKGFRILLQEAYFHGASGIIAPGTRTERIRELRKIVGNLLILTPGIGAQGGSASEAIKAGADFVIVGRAIYNASSPRNAAENIVEEIEGT